MYGVHKGRNSGILIFITFQVSIKIDWIVVYPSGHYSKQPLVNVQLTGLMCAPKFKYMKHTKVDTQEY